MASSFVGNGRDGEEDDGDVAVVVVAVVVALRVRSVQARNKSISLERENVCRRFRSPWVFGC